ncbi:MAG: peptidylprolyl isomerase [Magnetococcales bacterium]|nr:peptidylprolyl isomerase [Magnetococcales bacterium]MBF0440150.1 peptidylprolyl isomerase [Magnetococcales bacterium]
MNYKFVAIIFFVITLVVGNQAFSRSPEAKTPETKSAVLASMGAVSLTVSEFQNLMNYSDAEVKRQLLANPDLMKQKISEFMLMKFVANKARAEKADQKAEIAFMMERAKDGVLVEYYLNNASKPPADFPEEALIQKAYQENQSKFMNPPMVNVAQIFLKFDATMDDAAKKELVAKAERYVTMLQKKESDMASLAKKYSQHQPSASQGGDMGWLPKSQLLPEFNKALEGMKAGEVKGPVNSAQGVHIIQLIASKGEEPIPYDKVKKTVIQLLRNKKTQENKDAYLMELVKKQGVSVNEESRILLK